MPLSNPKYSIKEEHYQFLRTKVYEYSHIELGNEKKNLVISRLNHRLRALKLDDFEQYCELLQSHNAQEEIQFFVDSIATNHTYFFRENQHFEFLKSTIIPEYIKSHSADEILNIWSAPCSYGDEPYSIAITLHEANIDFHVTCSDISQNAINQAKEARYNKGFINRIPHCILDKYFTQVSFENEDDSQYELSSSLKTHISFFRHNILNPPFPFLKKFSVIFCRNLMIYLNDKDKLKLLNILYDQLLPNGYLFTGHCESLMELDHNLKFIAPAIYKKHSNSHEKSH